MRKINCGIKYYDVGKAGFRLPVPVIVYPGESKAKMRSIGLVCAHSSDFPVVATAFVCFVSDILTNRVVSTYPKPKHGENLGHRTKQPRAFAYSCAAELKPMDTREQLRHLLVRFFVVVNPPKAQLDMSPLLDYAGRHGIPKLNQQLFSKYGYNLEKMPPAVGSTQVKPKELPEYVDLMLKRYYAKHDKKMFDSGEVATVYNWAQRNGVEKLNRKLKETYGETLQEFMLLAYEVRDELIDFYRFRDRNMLITGILPILDWGLRNGRPALNEKLFNIYGVDLDSVNGLVYADVI